MMIMTVNKNPGNFVQTTLSQCSVPAHLVSAVEIDNTAFDEQIKQSNQKQVEINQHYHVIPWSHREYIFSE